MVGKVRRMGRAADPPAALLAEIHRTWSHANSEANENVFLSCATLCVLYVCTVPGGIALLPAKDSLDKNFPR